MSDEEWMTEGRCRDFDPDMWFADFNQPHERAAAIAICESCPVKKLCRAYGVDEEFGIFGGTTPNQRGTNWHSRPGRKKAASGLAED